MSYKNPNVNEILERSNGVIGKHFHKSYLNLAKYAFMKKYKRKATLDDAQELRNIFEEEWKDYYIDRPEREKIEREKSTPIWKYGCSIKINVTDSMIYFLRDIIKVNFDTQIKEINNGTFIIDNGLLEQWKEYVFANKDKLKYFRRTYEDYSHLAYNGVTYDF